MTTMTIEKVNLSLETVREIVMVMKKRKMNHIYPNKISNTSLRNEIISELIIDEEDTVFMMVEGEPVMLPQFAMVV